MTVGELESRMGASEIQEWAEYWRVEPWGSYRDNVHAGTIAATLANVYRKKNAKPLTFEDFMLLDPAEHRQKKTRETLAWMKAVAKRKQNNGP